jgi:hypothetical protein
MKIFILFFLTISTSLLHAKIVLPTFLAKQAVSNIRYLSQDGKFTYYQKRSGSLLYSSNYKVFEMIKSEIGTQYSVIGTPTRKKIVVTQNQNYHKFFSLRANEKIYLVDFGDTVLKEIGSGSSPKLHMNDSWISYYDFYEKKLHFSSTLNSAISFSIKLNNRINPYFNPQVVMSDDNTVYFTDLSETGAPGIIQFKRNISKADIIFKANTPMVKTEICLHNNNLIVGVFGINYSKEGSTISKSKLPLEDFSKRETIYSSLINDVGQLICDYDQENITFIKNYGTTDVSITDLVDLNPTTKSLKQLSEMKTVTSVINMDGTLLVLDKGTYFIAKGNIDYTNIDSLKSLPPDAAAESIKKIDDNESNKD